VTALSKCLLFALCLTLTSCASLASKPVAYLPPRIDCAELDAPRKARPEQPSLAEKSVIVWQLFAFGMGDYAESVLEQRYATAMCMQGNRKAGNIR
jgi:hypothetical protein